MRFHVVLNGVQSVGGLTVDALMGYKGGARIFAGNLPGEGVCEGWVRHVRMAHGSGTGVKVDGLQSCSAVLFCYLTKSKLTDVVAYHSPGGGINFKRDPERVGNLGTPSEEAAHYGIAGYDRICVVIANGEHTASFHRESRSTVRDPTSVRLEELIRVEKEMMKELLGLVRSDAHVKEQDILMYDCCDRGAFGVSAAGHIGEPGQARS